MLLQILSFLDGRELLRSRRVAKRWAELTRDSVLWKFICLSQLKPDEQSKPAHKSTHSFLIISVAHAPFRFRLGMAVREPQENGDRLGARSSRRLLWYLCFIHSAAGRRPSMILTILPRIAERISLLRRLEGRKARRIRSANRAQPQPLRGRVEGRQGARPRSEDLARRQCVSRLRSNLSTRHDYHHHCLCEMSTWV